MAETIWAPYVVKLKEQLDHFPLTWHPVWKDGESFGETATADKIAKAGIAVTVDADRLRFCVCSIFPAPGYDLPIFLSYWEERRDEIVFLVDLIPTVDILVDEPYRKKYVESLNPIWQRYESLAGICPEEHDGLRSVLSIVYTAARMPVEREGMRIAAIAPHLEYCKQYGELWKDAAPVADTAKLGEVSRRTTAVTKMLQTFLSTNPPGALTKQFFHTVA